MGNGQEAKGHDLLTCAVPSKWVLHVVGVIKALFAGVSVVLVKVKGEQLSLFTSHLV